MIQVVLDGAGLAGARRRPASDTSRAERCPAPGGPVFAVPGIFWTIRVVAAARGAGGLVDMLRFENRRQ